MYLLSRKIHRIAMFVMVPLSLIMIVTGVLMEEGIYLFPGERQLHSTFSITFSVLLTVMMMTGIVLYVYPLLIKRNAQKKK